MPAFRLFSLGGVCECILAKVRSRRAEADSGPSGAAQAFSNVPYLPKESHRFCEVPLTCLTIPRGIQRIGIGAGVASEQVRSRKRGSKFLLSLLVPALLSRESSLLLERLHTLRTATMAAEATEISAAANT